MSAPEPATSDQWGYALALGDLFVRAAWPLVAVGLAIAYRKSLSSLLTRVRRLPGGAEVDPVVGQQNATVDPRQAGVSGLSSTSDVSALARLQETRTWLGTVWPAMRAQLSAFLDQQLESMAPADREEYLRSNLMLSRRATGHLLALRHIFGSQQDLLQEASVGGKVTAAAIRFHYDRHVTRSRDLGIETQSSLPQWLSYLLRFGLMSGDEFGATITDSGRDFLIFSASTGEGARSL